MARTKQTARKTIGGKTPRISLGAPLARKSALGITLHDEKKKHRFRPGAKALSEIRKYQTTNSLCLKKLPFRRLVREIASGIRGDLRFENSAIQALQEISETYLIQLFEDANLCAAHCDRITVMEKDIQLAQRIRSDRW